MSNPNSSGGKPPDYAKLMKLGYDLNLKYAPKLAASDLALRQQFDPQFIGQQMGIQEQFDPRLAQEQADALQRRDPQWVALHQGLGDKIQQALQRGYVDPRQEAAYNRLSQMAGRVDPQYQAAYGALGKQVTGDTLRGPTADPRSQEQMQQAILARSPQLSSGAAQDMAAAVYTGQRGQQLQQQRQQATNQFLTQRDPTSMAQQSLGQFYGQNAPEMQAYGLAGTYIQPSNSIVNAENQIGGVQAPRSLAYMNPNAGTQAASFGLANSPAQMAYAQNSNPWTNALQGASAGAQYGSAFGGYGAGGGALTGAVAGAFGYPQYSSIKLKKNLSRTGALTKDGIELVEYDMDGKRWRGVIAEEVAEKRPDALFRFPGGRLGVFYSRLGVEQQEVN